MDVHTALAWLSGSFWGRDWDLVQSSLIVSVPLYLVCLIGVKRLNIFHLDKRRCSFH